MVALTRSAVAARRGQRGEQVGQGLLELGHHAAADQLPVPVHADLAGQEHRPAPGHGHGMGEAGGPSELGRVDPLHVHKCTLVREAAE